MKPGLKMAIFVLVATIFNVFATGVFFVGFFALYSISLGRLLPVTSTMWGVAGSFIASMAACIFLYKKLLVLGRKKFHLDERLGINAGISSKR